MFEIELDREGVRGPTRPATVPDSEPLAEDLDGVVFGEFGRDRLRRRGGVGGAKRLWGRAVVVARGEPDSSGDRCDVPVSPVVQEVLRVRVPPREQPERARSGKGGSGVNIPGRHDPGTRFVSWRPSSGAFVRGTRGEAVVWFGCVVGKRTGLDDGRERGFNACGKVLELSLAANGVDGTQYCDEGTWSRDRPPDSLRLESSRDCLGP